MNALLSVINVKQIRAYSLQPKYVVEDKSSTVDMTEPSTSSSNKLPAGQVIQSLYDYVEDVLDGKVLKFKKDDLFIVIKSTKPEEWIYVVNRDGKLGYVPANFIQVIPSLEVEKHLSLLDDILDKLSGVAPSTDMMTVRQINHARV